MEPLSQISFGLLNGVIRGTILALLASGLNVVFGLMKTVNVAHGSLYMVGAYLAWSVFAGTGSFWLSLVVSPLAVGVLAVAMGMVLRPIRDNSSLTILGTFAAALVFQGMTLVLWGGTPRRLPLPLGASFSLFGTGYSYYRVLAAGLAGFVLLGFWLVTEKTRFGLTLRASEEEPELSTAIGINVSSVYLLGFALGGALAGLSGSLIAPMVSLAPDMGLRVFAVVFLIVILGGLGNIWNSVLAALVFSVVRGIATAFLDATGGLIVSFSLVLLLILVAPDYYTGGNRDASQN